MRMKQIISAIAACVLVCGTSLNAYAADTGFSLPETASISYADSNLAEYAEQVAVLVNQERTAHGLQPVKVSPVLSEAANTRAGELKESFSHTRPNGTSCFTAMSELGITYRAAAENIAYGQRSPESVMNSWLNSAGHRANILNENMEYIGVGVVYRDGVYYWSQFFAASDSLSDGAYLPDENKSTSTTTPVTTTQPTTTTTTTQVTTSQTTSSQPIATEPITTQVTTSQTTSSQPVITEPTTTTTTTYTETSPCITITQPVISVPSSGKCYAVGKNAYIIIYHN